MTANTGRTVSRWTDFRVDDSAGTLRSIPINTIGAVGLTFDVVDLTAFQDALHGVLLNHPTADITIGGPLDNSAAQTAGTLSGSHTVLYNLAGGNTPLSLGIFCGIRHAWESGEPVFGITSTATAGYLCTAYTVDFSAGTYSATFSPIAGSTAPAWGTTAIT